MVKLAFLNLLANIPTMLFGYLSFISYLME